MILLHHNTHLFLPDGLPSQVQTLVLAATPQPQWRSTDGVVTAAGDFVICGSPHQRGYLDWELMQLGNQLHTQQSYTVDLEIVQSKPLVVINVQILPTNHSREIFPVFVLHSACLVSRVQNLYGMPLSAKQIGALFFLPEGTTGGFSFTYTIPLDADGTSRLLTAKDGWLPRLVAPWNTPQFSIRSQQTQIVANATCVMQDDLMLVLCSDQTMRIEVQDGVTITAVNSMRLQREFIDEMQKIIHFLDTLFADHKSFTIVEAATGNVEALSLPSVIVVNPALFDQQNRLLYRFLPHEITHQWLGNSVRFTGLGSGWLQESLPEFLQMLYIYQRFGELVLCKNIEMMRQSCIENFGKTLEVPICEWGINVDIYQYHGLMSKGVLAWWVLYKWIGIITFQTMLQRLIGETEPVDLARFRQILEFADLDILEGFFEAWVEHTGLPVFAISETDVSL